MYKDLASQVAVVTGGGSGIGQAICMDLAKFGVKAMVLDINEKAAEETKSIIEKAGGYAEAYKADVTNKEMINSTIDSIVGKHGSVDIMVSNAGINLPPTYCIDMSDEDWEKHMKVHLYQAFYLTKACGKIMKEQKYGRIIITSSLAAYHGMTGNIAYSSGKAGLVGFTYTLAKELGPYGITVNALQPGIIWTPMQEALSKDVKDMFAQQTPIPRVGESIDVSNVVTFLCKPESGFLTGLIIPVDGGYILRSGMDFMIMQMLNGPQAQ